HSSRCSAWPGTGVPVRGAAPRTGFPARCRPGAGSPSGSAPGSFLIIRLERLGARLAVALEQHPHLLFGLAQRALAVAGQADALLEGIQRLLQRQLAGLQPLDQLLQLGEGLFEIQGGILGGGHGAGLGTMKRRDTSRAGAWRQTRAGMLPWERLQPRRAVGARRKPFLWARWGAVRRTPSRSSRASCRRRPAAPARAGVSAAGARPARRRRSRPR